MDISSDGPNPPQILERGIVYGLDFDPSVNDVGVFTSADVGNSVGEFTMENVNIDDSFWDEDVYNHN